MENQNVNTNYSKYNIFSLCWEFRQRLEKLQRLKEKVLNENQEKDVNTSQ